MSRRFLPPLEVGTTYRARDFESFEFSRQSLHQTLTGEDIAILRLLLANETKLEIPVSDEDLKLLMRNLMESFPADAVEYAKERGWT